MRSGPAGVVILATVLLLGGCGDGAGRAAGVVAGPPPVSHATPADGGAPVVPASVTVTQAPTPDVTPTQEPPAPPPEPEPVPESEQELIERELAEVVRLTNAERAAAGCPAVERNDKLDEASAVHSADMYARNYLDHTNPDGESPWDRAHAAGYDSPASENIAVGYANAAEVVEGWMGSDGHRRNILNCDVVAIGVGVADLGGWPYWTQMFGYE